MRETAPSRGSMAVRPEGGGGARPAMVPGVRLVELRPGPTAVARATMHPDAITGWLGGTLPRLAVALNRQQVGRTGPAFARYTVHGALVEVEAGFRIRHAITGGTTATASGLPGGPAAVATHVGSAASLDAVYRDLGAWLDEHGLVEAGPHWEVYPLGPRLVSHAGLTRVVVPCRHRHAPVGADAGARAYVPTTVRVVRSLSPEPAVAAESGRGGIHLVARRS